MDTEAQLPWGIIPLETAPQENGQKDPGYQHVYKNSDTKDYVYRIPDDMWKEIKDRGPPDVHLAFLDAPNLVRYINPLGDFGWHYYAIKMGSDLETRWLALKQPKKNAEEVPEEDIGEEEDYFRELPQEEP